MLEEQHVFGVGVLCGFREVIAAGNYISLVDDHDLVVGDANGVVNPYWDAGIGDVCRARIFPLVVGLIQDCLYIPAAVLCIGKSSEDGFVREAICLYQYLALRAIYGVDNELLT